MPKAKELSNINDALDALRGFISAVEQYGALQELRHFAAREREHSWGSPCNRFWEQTSRVLDALIDFQNADDAHDLHHAEEPISLFGVEGEPQQDGTLRFDFDRPKGRP